MSRAPTTFSIVVCTHKRPSLLGDAIRSAMEQDYPAGSFEILVVDNAPSSESRAMALGLAERSPVPFRYVVEAQQGVAHARNRGVAEARLDYVAWLDDDEVADRTWLRAFDRVVNEHHALVVGGRVESVLPHGREFPRWASSLYVKRLFGVNYRDLGRTADVFRIRSPDFIGIGNSAYARSLFDRFGTFDTRLGRRGKGLLGAEETLFNLRLERYDVPIYYTDGALVSHRVEPFRLRKRHLARKAYCAGVADALMYCLLDGYGKGRAAPGPRLAELRRLVSGIPGASREAAPFLAACRIAYNSAFLSRLIRLSLSKRTLTEERLRASDAPWVVEDWIEEIESWPESSAKYVNLREAYLLAGDGRRAQEALERVEELVAVPRTSVPAPDLDALWGPLRAMPYRRLVERVRAAVEERVPRGARVVVASRGDETLLQFEGREGLHFPQTEDGVFAGCYPAGGLEAVAAVEHLRKRGAQFLVFPSTALWWLDHYEELARHLEDNYQVAARTPDCLIMDLRRARDGSWGSVRSPASVRTQSLSGPVEKVRDPRPRSDDLSWPG